MRNTFFFLLYAFLLLVSCGTGTKQLGIVKYRKTTDTIKLKHREGLSLFDVSINNNNNYLFLYRIKENEIVVVDLLKKEEVSSFKVPMATDTANEIGDLKSFYYYTKDSIILLHEYRISIADTAGKLKYTYTINNPDSEEWPPVVYGNLRQTFPMFFCSQKNELLIRQHCGNCERSDSNYYKTSIVASFSLKDSTFTDLRVSFPNEYLANYYGDADLPFREIKNDTLIISFATDPYILILDRKTGSVSKFFSKSKFQKKSIKPLDVKYWGDIDKRVEHLSLNPLYMKIMYDKYRNIFYRLFLKEQLLKNKESGYNKFGNKELIVMVLDSNFKTIDEVNLGSGYMWFYSFISSRGLYLLRSEKVSNKIGDNINGQKLQFDIFDFNVD
jgi:hypothetical protein